MLDITPEEYNKLDAFGQLMIQTRFITEEQEAREKALSEGKLLDKKDTVLWKLKQLDLPTEAEIIQSTYPNGDIKEFRSIKDTALHFGVSGAKIGIYIRHGKMIDGVSFKKIKKLV